LKLLIKTDPLQIRGAWLLLQREDRRGRGDPALIGLCELTGASFGAP
jgi:hypothetical protein